MQMASCLVMLSRAREGRDMPVILIAQEELDKRAGQRTRLGCHPTPSQWNDLKHEIKLNIG